METSIEGLGFRDLRGFTRSIVDMSFNAVFPKSRLL